jgi:2-iminobutanoate/2-iminopropanoate deaminase
MDVEAKLQRRQVCAGLLGAAAAPSPAIRSIHPTGASYAQGCLVDQPRRWLFVSGQVPADDAGAVPASFEEQCRLVWRNVARRLIAGGMTFDNLVKITVFLSDRRYRAVNTAIRREILGSREPALTVIIAGIFDEAWLLEIEAIAAE